MYKGIHINKIICEWLFFFSYSNNSARVAGVHTHTHTHGCESRLLSKS